MALLIRMQVSQETNEENQTFMHHHPQKFYIYTNQILHTMQKKNQEFSIYSNKSNLSRNNKTRRKRRRNNGYIIWKIENKLTHSLEVFC